MEDFFKFIPIALWVLYKIFGGSKSNEQKAKPKQKKRPNTTSTPSIEDILKELSGDFTAEKKVKPVKAKKKKESKRKKIEIDDHQHDFRPEYEHHADTGPSLESIKEEMKVVELGDEPNGSPEISLRDAIIYDAILNRPKY